MTSIEIPSDCNDIPRDFVDPFQAKAFSNTAPMEWFHTSNLRYGLSTDVLDLMEGSEKEQKEYLRGLISASLTIFAIVVLWMLALLIFKFMGPYRVGILSGKHKPIIKQQQQRNYENYNDNNNNNNNNNNGDNANTNYNANRNRNDGNNDYDSDKGDDSSQKFQEIHKAAAKWLKIYRVIVVFAGFSIVIASILMSIKGVDSLTSSLKQGREGIAIVSNLTYGGIDIVDRVLNQNDQTGKLVEQLLNDVNEICPKVRDPLCVDLKDISTCNFEGIVDQAIVEAVVSHFRGSERNVVYKELKKARQDLVVLANAAQEIDDQASQFNWALYCAMVFSLCLAALSLVVLVGILAGLPRVILCLRSWIIVPAFVVLVLVSFIFCLTFLIGSMALADMCINSPDSRIQVILDRFQDDLSPILVDFANFYINQCPEDQVPQEITNQITYIGDAITLVSDFTGVVAQTGDDGSGSGGGLQQICGFERPDVIAGLARATNTNLCNVVSIMITIRNYFQCQNWYPLYETTVYDAMCYNGTEGFAWVASTQFVVVLMAMVILTFRAAFRELDIRNEEDVDSGNDTGGEDSVDVPSPKRGVAVSHLDGGFEVTPKETQSKAMI